MKLSEVRFFESVSIANVIVEAKSLTQGQYKGIDIEVLNNGLLKITWKGVSCVTSSANVRGGIIIPEKKDE